MKGIVMNLGLQQQKVIQIFKKEERDVDWEKLIDKSLLDCSLHFQENLDNLAEQFHIDLNEYDPDNWKSLCIEQLKVDEDLKIIFELLQQDLTEKMRVQEYTEITGKSRASYFRYKARVSKSHV